MIVYFLFLEVIMHRFTILTISAFVFSLSGACNDAADEQKRANAAKIEATDKINAANAEADKKDAEAQTSFSRLREDYRHKITVNLVELDAKVETLSVQLKSPAEKNQIKRDETLKLIRVRRSAFGIAYNPLEGASSATWDAMQLKLDMEWSILKDLVDKA